ncbi:hypothetical protein [Mycolicibacterium fortuitum]
MTASPLLRVGGSGPALATATGKWEDESAARYTELIGHAEGYRSAAASYRATDDSQASAVEATAAAMKM